LAEIFRASDGRWYFSPKQMALNGGIMELCHYYHVNVSD
jgi:hypothetical protein